MGFCKKAENEREYPSHLETERDSRACRPSQSLNEEENDMRTLNVESWCVPNGSPSDLVLLERLLDLLQVREQTDYGMIQVSE